jgi:hypothetical protein
LPEFDGEIRPEPSGSGYFSSTTAGLDAAIDRLAGHDGPIAFFVGAGVSMEAGLPSWNTLLERLLASLGEDLEESERQRWMDATLREGTLAAAAIAQSLYDPEVFPRAVRRALYRERSPDHYAPGALAQQIAWLKAQLGPRLRLLTVNYDGLLEAALSEQGLNPVSYVRAEPEPPGRAAVWHLHGRLMHRPGSSSWMRTGRLVLSESDYVQSTYGTWPQEFVAHQLDEALCVFVGLSMTDPNFIRWLARYGKADGKGSVVIFVRQGAYEVDVAVRDKLEASAAARWARYGLEPVRANYYGEVAQLLHEVGLGISAGDALPFHERAERHYELGRNSLAPRGDDFGEAQRDASEWLQHRVADVRRVVGGAGVDLGREEIGLGLWAVNHERGVAELWVTSDRALTNPAAVEERPLHVFSHWVGVAALTQGIPVEQGVSVYTSRWQFVRAIPVIVEPTTARCVVGSVTLTSTAPLESCALSVEKAPPGLLAEIDRLLGESAAEFFTE